MVPVNQDFPRHPARTIQIAVDDADAQVEVEGQLPDALEVEPVAHHVNGPDAPHPALGQRSQRVSRRPAGSPVWIALEGMKTLHVRAMLDAGASREQLPGLETQALTHLNGHGLDHHLVEHETRVTCLQDKNMADDPTQRTFASPNGVTHEALLATLTPPHPSIDALSLCGIIRTPPIVIDKTIDKLRVLAGATAAEGVDCMTCIVTRVRIDNMMQGVPPGLGPNYPLIELDVRITSWS